MPDATGDRAGAPDRGRLALAEVRAWWRVRHPPPSLGRQVDLAYTGAIVSAIFGALAYGTASSALAQVVTPEWLARWGPALALLGLLMTAHWGAYQGPVVFAVADVSFLLGAPLPRRRLAAPRLARSLLAGAVAGALAAGGLIVGLAGQGRGIAGDAATGLVAGLAELGTFGVAGAWLVERSARWERWARWARWPAVLLAAALVAVPRAAVWSGPWGWALQAGTGAGRAAWLAALALLTMLTVVAAGAAVRGCGHCSAERHLRRAEGRASAVASLAGYDARTARRALEGVGPRGGGRGGAGLGRLRAPRLAVAWRDAAAAQRTPGRVVEGAALAAGGTVLGVLNADRPLPVAAAVLVAYAGASRLIWPLRAELDVPDRTRVLLRPRIGQVLLDHALVPALVVAAAAVPAAAGCAIAGADPAAALAAVAVTPALTACAANAARRQGRLPSSLLAGAIGADPSGGLGLILLWLALWPVTAIGVAGVPLYLAGAGGAVLAVIWTLLAAAGLARLLARDVAVT